MLHLKGKTDCFFSPAKCKWVGPLFTVHSSHLWSGGPKLFCAEDSYYHAKQEDLPSTTALITLAWASHKLQIVLASSEVV